MKTKRNYILRKLLLFALPLALVLGTIAGCEGPEGPQGLAGEQGPEGPIGPAGEDGSVIHAGTGTPASSLGKNGDYYLDQNTGELYGPKNDNGWGTPISLQGPTGQDGNDGEDGSQIYAGTGAPAASLGVEGDYYLNKTSYELYGPKTSSGWGTPLNLKGTANVMYSSWVTIPANSGEWTLKSIGADQIRYHDIAANAVTQDIIDKGVVNVYADFRNLDPNINHIYTLPMSELPGIEISFYHQYNTGNVRIAYFDPANRQQDFGDLIAETKFRYVIIPGGVAAKSKLSKEQLKKMSYQEVKKRFGIRELK